MFLNATEKSGEAHHGASFRALTFSSPLISFWV
jgi:hypothetical protein